MRKSLNHLFLISYELHKGKTKEKFNKVLAPAKFVDLFKTTLIGFPCYQFSVNHTSKTYDQESAGMTNSTIAKIHNFLEYYTCLLPEDIISIQWTQEQAKVYPVVTQFTQYFSLFKILNVQLTN